MASQDNVCPYILLTGKNKGQVCGKTISENGFCKLHAKKVNEVVVSCPFILQKGKNKGQECGKKTDESGYCKMHNPNQPIQSDSQSDSESQPNSQVEFHSNLPVSVSNKCPYVLQTGKNKGQICDKKTGVSGYCKLHEKKIQEQQPNIQLVQPNQPEIPLVENKCPCILQSGEKKGQMCGKNISENGFCKIHQKKCVQPQTLPIQPLQQPVFETKCPCVLQSGKNKGQTCGKEPTLGSKYCRFHQKTCVEPVQPIQPVLPIEPVIEEKEEKVEDIGFVNGPNFEELEQEISPKSPLAELENSDVVETESAESAESAESGEEQPEPLPEPSEPEPIIEEEILKDEEWNRFQVSEEQLQQILSQVQITNIDVVQLNLLENEILKCFG